MEDDGIIALYWKRSEQAIQETDRKYGHYCFQIAQNILENREDSEEAVSDTYMTAWKSIPPTRPNMLSAFLGKITRHISLSTWRKRTAEKRGAGETSVVLEELEECLASSETVETVVHAEELRKGLNCFVQNLPEKERKIFVSRYWYLRSVKYISERTGLSESNVKTMLFRIRGKLRKFLKEEDLL